MPFAILYRGIFLEISHTMAKVEELSFYPLEVSFDPNCVIVTDFKVTYSNLFPDFSNFTLRTGVLRSSRVITKCLPQSYPAVIVMRKPIAHQVRISIFHGLIFRQAQFDEIV